MRLFIVFLVILVTDAVGFCGELIYVDKGSQTSCTVVKITDGDTIEVRPVSGATFTVRLLGINTPEKGTTDEPYAIEATEFTKTLLNGTISLLVSNNTKQMQDLYGRTVGVIIYQGEVFNTKLLERGLATRCFIDNDCLNFLQWEKLEVEARKQGLGLWSNIGKQGIVINELYPNPKGTDSSGGEFVELFNTTDKTVSLDGWNFGIDEDTVFGERDAIAPYGYLILTSILPRDFRTMHPEIPNDVLIIRASINSYGTFLSNSATPPENLVVHLKDDKHEYQDSFTYNLKWDNKGADGTGYTLERIDVSRKNIGDSQVNGVDDENWETSTLLGGTPGMFNSIGTVSLVIILPDSPMLGKAMVVWIQAMGVGSQTLNGYCGTISLTLEPVGVISDVIVVKNGIGTASLSFSQLGSLTITAKDTMKGDRYATKEFKPKLLGDFGQNGNELTDNKIDFNDLMWFSYYWNTGSTKADIGSAQLNGNIPAFISPSDSKVNISDLMIFSDMCNWWNWGGGLGSDL
ncbi:MAG: thermonuclease family protein [Candidatus Desantisbacteria bacterium]